jgi:hypothetical protein
MQAVRLLFRIDPESLTLISARSVDVRVPRSQAQRNIDGKSGAWVEVRGAEDRLLYRRAVSADLLAEDVEVRSEAPGGGMVRRPGRRRARLFYVDVPAAPEAAKVRVIERTARPPRRLAARRLERAFEIEHAAVDLRALRIEPVRRKAD